MACNNSGVWNEEGATLEFVIPPMYYQTTWFRVLVRRRLPGLALRGLSTPCPATRAPVQHDPGGARERAHTHRARTARHSAAKFSGTSAQVPIGPEDTPRTPTEARQRLESALDQAAAAITEGRDAVQGLRSSAFETNDLANGIIAIGKELTSDASAPILRPLTWK